MADITITPITSSQVQVNGEMIIGTDEAIDLMTNGKNAGYSFHIDRNGHGHNLVAQIESAALELAGLTSFAAAKQTAKGYIEF